MRRPFLAAMVVLAAFAAPARGLLPGGGESLAVGNGQAIDPACGGVLGVELVAANVTAREEYHLAAVFGSTDTTCAWLPAQTYTGHTGAAGYTWSPARGGCLPADALPGTLCLFDPYYHGQGIYHFELRLCGARVGASEACASGRADLNFQ